MDEEKKFRHCPNCGEIVDNRFCPACGQENKEFNHTFREMSSEFISHTFNLDSRFVKTLRLLIFKPGYLTLQYFKGRREAYISPFKLYLIISMVYFLTFTMQYFYSDIQKGVKLVQSSIQAEQADSLNAFVANQFQKPEQETEEAKEANLQLFNQDVHIDQDEIKNAFTNNSPRIMFFLLPLVAIILKLLYSRRKFLYYKHLIFLLHLHAFFFLLMTISRILPYTLVEFLVLLAIMAYLYIAFKKFYQQGVFKTIFKILIFSTSYTLILAMLSLINLLISIFTII